MNTRTHEHTNTRTQWIILILFVSIVLSIPLFQKGYFIGHEFLYPFFRVLGIDSAIQSGQFPAKVLPNLANGFGYGWNIFYPPLSYEVTWLIYKTGFSLLHSIKIVHFLTVFLSGIFMFFLVYRVSKNDMISFIAAILYMSSPYGKVDIFVRNAYGESFAFIFLPLVFYGLYEIMYGNHKKIFLFTIGFAGLILTHNITALYTGFFLLLFALLNARVFIKSPVKILVVAISGLLSLFISAYFIVPLFEHLFFGQYAVFTEEIMGATPESVQAGSIFISQFFGFSTLHGETLIREIKYLAPHTLILAFAALIASAMKIICRDVASNDFTNKNRFFLSCTILGFISFLMMLNFFPWKLMPSQFLYIQFPWRLFMFTTFFFSIAAALIFNTIKHQYRNLFTILILSISIFIYFWFNRPTFHTDIIDSGIAVINDKTAPVFKPDIMVKENSIINDNTPHILGIANVDYLPLKAHKNLKFIINRDNDIKLLSGKIQITNINKFGTNLNFSITLNSKSALIELPLIYYLGYKAYYHNKDGKVENLKITESPRGFCAIYLQDQETGKIYVSYEGTSLFKLSKICSLAGIISLIMLAIFHRRLLKN